ncbi:MAG: AbrB family transcriptional regulator [Pseudomonadota bacterium]|nr:AbrB family transcriptional regulator [Pseudomonadota bacterium]
MTLALALASAGLFQWLHAPLPWMIGPLLTTAVLGIAGLPLLGSNRLRNVGQWMIGIALGLYFTPDVVGLLLQMAPAVVAGSVWALVMGYLSYRLLLRAGNDNEAGNDATDHATAFFAGAIGGASEMALLAERNGGRVDRVAAAHSMRVLIVVVLVPFLFQASGLHGADPSQQAVHAIDPLGLLLLLAASAGGIALMGRLGTPNPFVLGALLVTIGLTASGIELSALPKAASNAGQLFIGVALGARFTPEFARAAPRWLGVVFGSTLLLIAASAAFAWLLARGSGLHPASVMLGTAPGGMAEMCITAKVLQLGVPVVTAFHVVRYVVVLTLTAPLYRRVLRRALRRPL